jgi:hypothetical protein
MLKTSMLIQEESRIFDVERNCAPGSSICKMGHRGMNLARIFRGEASQTT